MISKVQTVGTVPATIQTKLRRQFDSNLTAQFGKVFAQRVLAYIKAGMAFTRLDYSMEETTGLPTTYSVKKSKAGLVIAGGAEYAFNQKFTMRLEGRYLHYGAPTLKHTSTVPATYRSKLKPRALQFTVGGTVKFDT